MTSPAAATAEAPAATGLEDVKACALCGGAAFEPYAEAMYALDGRRLDLCRCHACGFVFVSPRPTAERLRQLYADEKYYENDYTLGVSEASYFARRDELLAHYDGVVAALERVERPGRIFEVGAAGGFFLAAAAKRGWQAAGVEISPFAASYAREQMGLPVQTGDVTEADVAPGSQDVVYVDNILEHTIDPLDVLHRLHAMLRPGGLLVVIVPTYVNSAYFRLLKGLRDSRLGAALARRPIGLLLKLSQAAPAPPYHIDEFSTRSIAAAVRRTGLHVARVERSVPIPDYLGRPGGGASLLLQRLAFRSGDALMRAGLLPGARTEVHGRKRVAG